jgi:hypothetical protein
MVYMALPMVCTFSATPWATNKAIPSELMNIPARTGLVMPAVKSGLTAVNSEGMAIFEAHGVALKVQTVGNAPTPTLQPQRGVMLLSPGAALKAQTRARKRARS